MKSILIVSVLLIGLFTLLSADPGCMDGKIRGRGMGMTKGHHGKMMQGQSRRLHRQHASLEYLKDELDLSEQQVEQMRDEKMAFEKKRIEKEAEIKKLQLDRIKAREDHDFNKLKNISVKLSKLRQEIAQMRIELHEKHWNLLTKEQQKKAEELKEEKFHRRHDFHRRMMQDDEED